MTTPVSDAARRRGFTMKLLRWFASAMRSFPWRDGYDPYHVWVSEIMLQQTQAERGAARFVAWMRRFPDIRSVAEASEEAVLAAWEGLGYYSRARNLRAAARRIVDEHGGEFPSSLAAIRDLPGVGEYTAGAIAAIAFNQPVAAVDANVMRVFLRVLDLPLPVTDKGAKTRVTDTVLALMPADSPRLFCQALMELGALVCGRNPRCGECPVAGFCLAHHNGTVADRPSKSAKAGRRLHEMAAAVVRCGGRVFIRKRPPGGLWAGMWEFPSGPVAPGDDPERAAVRYAEETTGLPVSVREKIGVVRHGYTTNQATVHGYLCDAAGCGAPVSDSDEVGIWVRPGETGRYAFPAGHRKLLEKMGWKGEK